jgi:glutamate N-acetyltransferase/amino-acid N-acetyltransferase
VSVTAPRGFLAAGVSAGLRAGDRPDLGLLFSQTPASAAGLFTRNALPAAPVVIGRRRVEAGTAQAVVVNSGQANAGTGDEGLEDAAAVSTATALALGIDVAEVIPCSTGVIGPRIDVARAGEGVRAAVAALSPEGGPAFAEAILTTDPGPKQVIVDGEGGFVIGACAKGAGMIAPDLATLLVFLTTDAVVPPATATAVLRRTAAPIWNGVTVDGCQSTNDTVLLMANGASGVQPDPGALAEAVAVTCTELARRVVSDAEGATTSVIVQVDGAATDADARAVGRAVAGSLLVKTAVFGKDPNPGRILAAVGASGIRLKPWAFEARIGDVVVIRGGRVPASFDPEACANAMKEGEVVIRIGLGEGRGSATAFGCDLGYEYVRINAEYTT